MYIVRSIFLISIYFAINSSTLEAEQGLSLSVEEAIQMGLKNNRHHQIASLEIERARSKMRWAGMLSNPDLRISASDDFAGLDEGENELEITFSQKFPVTSRLREEKNLRKVEVWLAEAELAENRRKLAHEIHTLCVTILDDEVEARAHERLIQLNKEIVESLQRRARQGEVSPLEINQMKLRG